MHYYYYYYYNTTYSDTTMVCLYYRHKTLPHSLAKRKWGLPPLTPKQTKTETKQNKIYIDFWHQFNLYAPFRNIL